MFNDTIDKYLVRACYTQKSWALHDSRKTNGFLVRYHLRNCLDSSFVKKISGNCRRICCNWGRGCGSRNFWSRIIVGTSCGVYDLIGVTALPEPCFCFLHTTYIECPIVIQSSPVPVCFPKFRCYLDLTMWEHLDSTILVWARLSLHSV